MRFLGVNLGSKVYTRKILGVDSILGAMAQLVARSTPDRAVGSSSLSGLTLFLFDS